MPDLRFVVRGVSCLFGAVLCAQDPVLELRREFEARLGELERRLAEQEEHNAELEERIGSRAALQSYSARSVDLGGHLSALWTGFHGRDGTSVGNYAALLELYLKAQVDEHWSLFATPGFFTASGISFVDPDEPVFGRLDRSEAVDFAVLMTRAYAEYHAGDALRWRAGVIGTPHGTINREYFIPSRITGLTPLMTRLFTGNQLYAQMLIGTSLSGSVPIGAAGGNELQYEAYFGSETNDSDDPEGGARLGLRLDDPGATVAVNWGRGRRSSFTDLTGFPVQFNTPIAGHFPWPSASDTRHAYEFVGVDLDVRKGDLQLQAEAYHSREAGGEDHKGAFLQPTWFFTPGFAISYRFDYFDTGADRGHATEQVLTLLHDASANVRLRLDFHHMELPASDASLQFLNFSFSTSF